MQEPKKAAHLAPEKNTFGLFILYTAASYYVLRDRVERVVGGELSSKPLEVVARFVVGVNGPPAGNCDPCARAAEKITERSVSPHRHTRHEFANQKE